MGRGGHLGGAGDEPKLLVESVALGAAGIGADGERGGGRSSGELGVGVRELGRRSWWDLRAPGSVENAVTCLISSPCGCGHDSDVAGGAERSGSAEMAARGRNRGVEEGG